MNWEWVESMRSAKRVIPCSDLIRTLSDYKNAGFRCEAILGADNPAVAIVSREGSRIRLQQAMAATQIHGEFDLELPLSGQSEDSVPDLNLPSVSQSTVVQKLNDKDWHPGRVVEMQYRDLIPGRQGNRFIASHIRIAKGGKVNDDVHFHWIKFQMIYCHKGWARLLYEGQGKESLMREGDCVLQPPEIRHQVLESSDRLEVIEIASPANHWTFFDHELDLNNCEINTERRFDGQSFVHADEEEWRSSRKTASSRRDLGIAKATGGIASASVVYTFDGVNQRSSHNREFFFTYILDGTVRLSYERGESELLNAGDCFVIKAGTTWELSESSPNLQLLEVTLPAVA